MHRISALIEHVNGLIVQASSLIMPSGPPVDGSSEMDDLTSLLRQLAADRREDQDRRETDRNLQGVGAKKKFSVFKLLIFEQRSLKACVLPLVVRP